MRVVGLISGGKDSIWNLHYCRHFGHELVCVANLAPPQGVSELDSYMYQTVGSDMIDAIAGALGLPLVRRVISGEPKATSSNAYSPEDGDEVEDLTLLLREVLEAHPDVQAVSCGAILSNYQRLRVENVCGRLGLKVLAFMWRQEQELLLRQMIDSEVDARIAKVASMGLKPRHVGESILSPAFAEHVFGLGARWGVHVCGEGGEYETTVVDAPLYRHPVKIVTSETVAHPDGGDDVAFLRVAEAEAGEAKGAIGGPRFPSLEAYSSLRYYEETYPQLPAPARDSGSADAPLPPSLSLQGTATATSSARRPALRRVGQVLASSALDAESLGVPPGEGATAAQQCEAVLGAAATWLREEHGRSLHEAAFAEVQVRDLGCFEAVNAVYARFFGADPPPRVCIQTPLPEALHLRVRLLLRPKREELAEGSGDAAPAAASESLRVQSISTWAMACIGPYSQALRVGPLLLSAGVIGLVPHTMALPTAAEAAAAAAAAAEGPAPGETPCQQWEAELWMLMRSLGNVLQVIGSGFGEARLAHVYVAGAECDLSEAAERVLAYMRRDSPGAAPILACAKVPRLPKDGSVEVNVVCCAGEGGSSSASSASTSTVQIDGAAAIQGRVDLAEWRAPGVRISTADFVPAGPSAELAADAVASAVERCATEALSPLQGSASGLSLQVQCALPAADAVAAAAAEGAAEKLGLVGACAVSCMPVASLGPGVLARCIVLTI